MPFIQTAAEVSSQEDSIPRIVANAVFQIKLVVRVSIQNYQKITENNAMGTGSNNFVGSSPYFLAPV